MKAYEQTLSYLRILKLKGAADRIDELITDAERQKISYMTFLNSLLSTEITYR
ncbi:MAG: ATP-binding protein, partial [Deltaproteobacteria bacterium]